MEDKIISKRILLISANIGSGHIRAAQAIHSALEERDKGLEILHLELLEHAGIFFRTAFSTFYGTLIKRMPSLWRIIYERADRGAPDSRARRIGAAFSKINSRRLMRAIESFDADHIVCTHFTPAEVVSTACRERKIRAKLSVIITDYDIHNVWLHHGVDDYFVATQDMARAMPFRGIRGARIHASGIPICSKYSPDALNRRNLREQMGLDLDRPTILLTGGGCGLGDVGQVARALCENFPYAQCIAVAGNNQRLFAELKEIASRTPARLIPCAFVSNMHELMAVSDLAITKSGGMTCSECLATGLPMVIVNPIPGQEERNCDYLLECGAAVRAHSLAFLISKVTRIFADEALRRRMSDAARSMGRPHAASCIAGTILNCIPDSPDMRAGTGASMTSSPTIQAHAHCS